MRSSCSLLVLALAACTDGTRDTRPVVPAAPAVPVAPAAAAPVGPPELVVSPPRRVHANGLLIEIGGHGPRLCLGGWEESLPPQCGDIPVVGLDWAKMEGETRTDDTVWYRA